MTSHERVQQLRRRLLEDYDVPVRADDELLGLAATMLELLDQAQQTLQAQQQEAFELQKAAVASAASEVLLKAKAEASELTSATKDACSAVASSIEAAAERLEAAAAHHERAGRYSTWVGAGFACLATVSAIAVLAN